METAAVDKNESTITVSGITTVELVSNTESAADEATSVAVTAELVTNADRR